MPGALMQLVAYGEQNIYLTGNPQMTYWKAAYKRCSNFAIESIEQTFNGRADFGDYAQCVIGRNGDLMFRTYLVATLPKIDACWTADVSGRDAKWARWLDYPGENLIDYVEIEIGGTRIDRQYGEWMHIWNQLTLTNEKREGYYKMIGHTTELTYLTMGEAYADGCQPCCKQVCDCSGMPCNTCAFKCFLPETTIYIPLQFWFCRNPGLALPLLALQFHGVKLSIQFRNLDELLWAVDSLNDGSGNPALGDGECGISQKSTRGAYEKSLVTCSLFVDFIFLDRDERRYMAQNAHEYLIEQVQYTGANSVATTEANIVLDFNHPCKELFFTLQEEYFRDVCKQFESCEPLYKALGAQMFNYTDCIDAMPPAHHAFHAPTNVPGAAYGVRTLQNGLFRNPGAGYYAVGMPEGWDPDIYADGWQANPPLSRSWAPLGGNGSQSLVSDAGALVLAETALNMHCWGKNPITRMVLQLNGRDRFTERKGEWFDLIQPFKYHTHIPDTGINVYSFALMPENYSPSGVCNFSRIDNVNMRFTISPNMFNVRNESVIIKLYATNYNILRVMGGMGGLAFSN